MTVRQLDGADPASPDIELYRSIRLEALAADPQAFASTYAVEAAFDTEKWRTRLLGFGERPGVAFIDEVGVDERPVATASIGFTEWDAAPMLVGMWVRPEARGMGASQRLIDACAQWARDQGSDSVVLWVVRDNHKAIELYRRCGFIETGETDTLPSNPCAEELEMRLSLISGRFGFENSGQQTEIG